MRRFIVVFAFMLSTAAMATAVKPVAGAEADLLQSAESGDRAAVLALLAKGANVNAAGPDGSTALMYAAANDDIEMVRALTKAGADVNRKNQFGTSALTEASIIGSAQIIEALLKAGADANFKNPYGETPLMAAGRSGKVEAARLLLDAGADINAKETWGGQTALMWAASQGQAGMVKFLASKGANLNDRGKVNQWERKILKEPRPKDMNKGGFSALHYAAREGCPACVKNLLEAGADPDSEDPDRMTPLLLALMNYHFDTAAVLIEGGADLDKWDLWGRSPIYMAADVSTLPLKGNGAMAVIPSGDKLTAVDVARRMLEKGANPNIQLKRRPPMRDVPQDRGGDGFLAQGATPLLRAARAGDAPFVEVLVKFKALVDLPNKDGGTALMAAAGMDYGGRVTRGRNRTDEGVLATMKILIDAGADVNARNIVDRGGGAAGGRGGRGSQMPSLNTAPNQTALHIAASKGYTKFVEFLAKNGADLEAKDSNGRTALDIARGGGGGAAGAPRGGGTPAARGGGRGAAAPDAFPETAALLRSLQPGR
jgi:ankyrin repeat protein